VRERGIPRDLRRLLVPGLVLAALAGGVLWFVGSLPHSLPQVVLVVLLAGAVGVLLVWALGHTGRHLEPAYWASTPRQESVPPTAMDYRLVRLRRDLRDALDRDDRPDLVYPVLRELTQERLRAHHDLDLDTQPEQARAVLDPQLVRYLSTPPTDTRRRSKALLHSAIEGIEKL
jgi:hypothetical protein